MRRKCPECGMFMSGWLYGDYCESCPENPDRHLEDNHLDLPFDITAEVEEELDRFLDNYLEKHIEFKNGHKK